MSTHVSWLFETKIKPGKVEDAKTLVADMVEATRAESGTLIYEYYLSDDEQTLHMYERYEDSAAVMVHLGNFNEKFSKRFFDALEPKRLHVYGTPDETARKAMADAGARFLSPLEGFMR